MNSGGDVQIVGGVIPTPAEVDRLIAAIGGRWVRGPERFNPHGVSHHTYWHMHFTTATDRSGTIQTRGSI